MRAATSVLNTIGSEVESRTEEELPPPVAEAGGPVSTALKDRDSSSADITPMVVASVVYASFTLPHPPTRP